MSDMIAGMAVSYKPFNVGPTMMRREKIGDREHLCARKAPRDA